MPKSLSLDRKKVTILIIINNFIVKFFKYSSPRTEQPKVTRMSGLIFSNISIVFYLGHKPGLIDII